MTKRLTMLMGGLVLSTGMALAQTTVTGKVVSQEDGEPIIGASVRIVGTKTGTATDVMVILRFQMPARMLSWKSVTSVCRLKL